jgi:hypothetical protein
MTIELTEDEFDMLLICIGYAIGAALKDDEKLGYSFVRVANAVCRDRPNFTPYEIPGSGSPDDPRRPFSDVNAPVVSRPQKE